MVVNHFRFWHKADVKIYRHREAFECRVSGMEAPDEVTRVCRVKWRRKPGVAGYGFINSACLPPALVSFNPLSAMKKLRQSLLTPVSGLYGVHDVKGVISGALAAAACC